MEYTEELIEKIDEFMQEIREKSILKVDNPIIRLIKYNEVLLSIVKSQKEKIDKKDKRIFYLEIEARKIIEQNIDKEKINIYENYISKDKIIEKIKEIEDNLKEDCIALHKFQRLAKIDVLKEILNIRRVIKWKK